LAARHAHEFIEDKAGARRAFMGDQRGESIAPFGAFLRVGVQRVIAHEGLGAESFMAYHHTRKLYEMENTVYSSVTARWFEEDEEAGAVNTTISLK